MATSRHDPNTIQLSARIPRELHQQFYAACAEKGITGTDMLRLLMETFINKSGEQRSHGQA